MYLNESTCSTKYSLNAIHKPTFHWNTDYVRHFNYVRQSVWQTILTCGELLYSWSESTGFRVTQFGLLQSFDTDS
jgi:hypothetical protein